jgi:hypothetical protein
VEADLAMLEVDHDQVEADRPERVDQRGVASVGQCAEQRLAGGQAVAQGHRHLQVLQLNERTLVSLLESRRRKRGGADVAIAGMVLYTLSTEATTPTGQDCCRVREFLSAHPPPRQGR